LKIRSVKPARKKSVRRAIEAGEIHGKERWIDCNLPE
jgi:hypothetical protein